jgi:hypothetical protein
MGDVNKGFREGRREVTQSVSASTLATIFGTSTERVRERIGHLTPVAEYKGSPLYRIRDAAPYLVRPAGIDVEEIVKGLKPAQLPTALQKDFWAAQRTRLDYQEEAGELWKTDKVQMALADIFKIIRQQVLMTVDSIDRQTALTQEQRRLVQQMMDGLLESTHQSIIEHFEEFSAEDNRDELFEKGTQDSRLAIPTLTTDDPNEGL